MNMQALMAQARKIQNNLEKETKEIESKEYVFSNENIELILTGDYLTKKMVIKNNDILLDSDLLSDVITVAYNNLINKIKSEKNQKLGKYTGGLGGLF